ncbi:hypothetical protein GCM10023196_037080 [Actinoallomurus vinaceus]|uniref:MFS transporter n=1 Tax=Actinoallomurus vinaceus TaxID=1080074 RepID=A0ABP8UCJ9_9ACTN
MRVYVDVPAHSFLLAIRAPLGAGTAWLFASTGQISGPYAALAFGFAAPAVLAQLGRLRGVDQAVQGNDARVESLKTPEVPMPGPVADQSQEVELP